MRDIKRIDKICELLAEYWKIVPDWRLSQLFCNLQRFAGNDLFYYEDDELMSKLSEMLSGSKVDN